MVNVASLPAFQLLKNIPHYLNLLIYGHLLPLECEFLEAETVPALLTAYLWCRTPGLAHRRCSIHVHLVTVAPPPSPCPVPQSTSPFPSKAHWGPGPSAPLLSTDGTQRARGCHLALQYDSGRSLHLSPPAGSFCESALQTPLCNQAGPARLPLLRCLL